eukprot:403370353
MLIQAFQNQRFKFFATFLIFYHFSVHAAQNYDRDKNRNQLKNEEINNLPPNSQSLKDINDYDETDYGNSYSKQNQDFDFKVLFDNQPETESCESADNQFKRNLQTTCPSNILLFPVIIGGTTVDCNCAVTLYGLDADNSGQTVVSGLVDSCGTNNCPIQSDFTTGTLTSAAFIQVLTNQGNNKWISNLNADEGQIITNPIFMDGNVFGISIGAKFRIFKLDGATGAKLLEQNADSFLSSNDPALIPQLEMSADLANSLIYLRMKINTNFFTATDHEFILMRLSPLLTVNWIVRSRGLNAAPSYDTLDLFISSDKLWHLGWFYITDTSTQRLAVQKMSKVDGSIESEQLIIHEKPANLQGIIRLNQNESSWYGLMYQGSSNYVQTYYGTTSDNSLINSYKASWTLLSINMEIQNTTGLMIVTGIQAYNELAFVIINPTNGAIAGQKKITRGVSYFTTPKHQSVQRGNFLYSAFNQQYADTNLTLPRIILFKTDYFLNIEKWNCINTTSPSLGALSVSDITGKYSTSSTPTYNLVYESLTFNDSLAETTIAQQTYTDIQTYTMRDTTTNQYCNLPLIFSITNITYNFNTQSSGLVTIGDLSIADCSGSQYQWNDISLPDGTDSGGIYVQVLPSTLKLNLSSNTPFNYYAAFSFRITVFNYFRSTFYYGRIVGIPKTSAYRDPTSPNHDSSSCNDVIYPFYWGSLDYGVTATDFKLDQWGNHMMTGSGQFVPFSITSMFTYGFIYLGDQRGNPYWNLVFNNQFSSSSSSSCIGIYQISSFVYAACSMYSEEFLAQVPVIIKVLHANGQLMYAKRLPVDRYSPSQNRMFHMTVQGSDVIAFQYYQSLRGTTIKNIAVTRFTEQTNNIVYFKFLNNNGGSSTSHIFSDLSTGSFYQFRHNGSAGETIFQGKLSDGSIIRSSIITDANSQSLDTQYAMYKTDLMLVPVLTYAILTSGTVTTAPQLSLYVMSRVDLSMTKRLKFVFTTQYQFQSCSANTDSSDNIYMTAAMTQVYFVKLDSSYNIVYQKLWKKEYIQYISVGLQIWNGNVFNGLYGRFTGSDTYTIIFKNFGLQDNCFEIPDLPVSDATYAPVFSTPTSSNVVTTLTDFSEDADYPTDNYQLLQEINTIYIRSFRYHQSETTSEKWGDFQIPGKYFQYPFNASQNQRQCSMISLPYTFKDPSIYEFKIGTTTSITISSNFYNCQGKKIKTIIYSPSADSAPSITGYISNTLPNGNLNITFDLRSYTGLPKQFHLRARYYDVGASTYTYIDHTIQIRYVASSNITISNSNYSNCYQNVFPLSYGGWYANGTYLYAFMAKSFTANDTDQNMVSSGLACTGNDDIYMYSAGDKCDAYIMRLSTTGAVEWLSQFNLGSQYDDYATALTLSPLGQYGFIYGIVLPEVATYSANSHALVKLTYNEGKMVWAKRILQRNLIDTTNFFLLQFQDFQTNPRNQSTFMGSGLYYINSGVGLVSNHMMFYDNGTDLNTVFQYQLNPLGSQSSLIQMVGQTLFDPFDNFVYITAALFIRTSTFHDLAILKLNPDDGTIIWTRMYDTNISVTSQFLLPVIKMNNLTKSIYVAHPTQDMHLIKLTSAGVTEKRVIMKISSGAYFQSTDLVMNHLNGNIIVIGTILSSSGINQKFEMTQLDKDLIAIDGSKTYYLHLSKPFYGRLTYQFKDYFYTMLNTIKFSNPHTVNQVMANKFSVNHWDYFYKHACHIYSSVIHSSSSLAYAVGSETEILPNSIFFSNSQIRFKDSNMIQMWQLQTYNSFKLFPQGDYEAGSSASQYSLPTTSNDLCYDRTGLSRTASELYPIEVTIGEKVTYLLNATSFLQCQGAPLTIYSVKYETSTTTSTAANSFITIALATGDSTKVNITIDATIAGVVPSVRYLVVSTTLSWESKSATTVQPLVIWPAVQSVLPTSVASLCPENKQKYPKIWDASPNHVYYRDGDIDDSNGNMLVCGKTIATTWKTANYYDQQQGFILTLDKNGQQYWGHSATSVTTGIISEFSSCAFGPNQSGVYALLLSYPSTYVDEKVILVKFEYGRGRPVYMRQAAGSYDFSVTTLYNIFAIDKADNAIYIAGNRTEVNNKRNHQFAKIDISGDYPVQQYISYATSAELIYNGIQTMLTSEKTDFFYVFGAICYQGSNGYQVFTKYNKTTGAKLANLAYSHSLSGGAYISQVFVEDGTFIYIAVTQNSYSLYASKITISTFTHALDRSYDHLYAMPCATGMTQDDDYIYIAYIADGQQEIMNKLFKANMTVAAIYRLDMLQSDHSARVKLIMFDSMIYNFGDSNNLVSNYQAVTINQYNTTMGSPYSCLNWIINSSSGGTQNKLATSSIYTQLTYTVEMGEYRLVNPTGVYLEMKNGSQMAIKEIPALACGNYKPQFLDPLVDQIITLPITSKSYTFNWPSDCFNSELGFDWSVDKYTGIPTFMTMTNGTGSSTLKMTPLDADIGTYVVRLKFWILSNSNFVNEQTFTVEIYPSVSYGYTNSDCPTSVIPAIFYGSSTYAQFYTRSDMDSTGSNFIMCGSSFDLLNNNAGYYSGFIQQYTYGMTLNFHLSIEWDSSDAGTYHCLYGYQNDIFAATHQVFTRSSTFDKVMLTRHTKNGKYQAGKQIYTMTKYFQLGSYSVDTTNGDQYLSGQHYLTPFTKTSYYQMFLIRLDNSYNLIFFRTYDTGNNIYGKNLIFERTSNNIYQTFVAYYSSYSYWGMQQVDITTGATKWKKFFYDNSNRQYKDQSSISKFQTAGIEFVLNGYVAMASISYLSYSISPSSYSGYEIGVYIMDPSTGNILNSIDLYETASYAINHVQLEYSSTNSILACAYTYNSQTYVSFFTITVSYPYIAVKPTFNYFSSGATMYTTSLYLRNSQFWIFSSSATPSRSQYALLYAIKDPTLAWVWTCSPSTSNSDLQYYKVNPGLLGASSSYWQTFPSTWTESTISLDLFNRWYSNMNKVIIFPSTSQVGNIRATIDGCSKFSNPSKTTVSDRLGLPISTTEGGFSVGTFNHSYILPKFTHCSGEPLTYTMLISPSTSLPAFISFDAANQILRVSPWSNSYIGTYILRYTAKVTASTSNSNYTDFTIQVVKNQPPVAFEDFPTSITLISHHNFTWTINFKSDNEGDLAIFNAYVLSSGYANINSSISYFKIIYSNDQGIKFSFIDPPQLSFKRYINVTVGDDFNPNTPNFYLITVQMVLNDAPQPNVQLPTTLSSIYITGNFAYTFWYQNFTDAEGDATIISCTMSTNANSYSWIQHTNDPVTGNITFKGNTPRNNIYAGLYTFTCTVSDKYDGTPYSYVISLQVLPKPIINILRSYPDKYIRLPENITFDLSGSSSDPLNQPNIFKLYINNTLYDPLVFGTWIYWDSLTKNITVVPNRNSQGGNHTFEVEHNDQISAPQYVSFKLEVMQNWPLIKIKNLDNIQGIAGNWFFFDYNQSEIFQNPEGENFTVYWREKSMFTNPYFVRNFSNGTIGGFTTDIDVGSYTLEFVGVDDAYWETPIEIILVIKPCYYKCDKCWDSDYNTCRTCKPGFFLYNAECLDQCVEGTYPNPIEWKCMTCPLQCKTCTGPESKTQCSTCKPGFYKLNNGCYDKCPDGYWGDKTDYSCKLCNPSCTLCFGPSATQCTNCTVLIAENEIGQIDQLGYLLTGTECKLPKCIDGQYFEWFQTRVNGIQLGTCQKCHERCKRCTGPTSNQCIQCYRGALLNQKLNTCTYCHELLGLFTNEEFECEDVCGDGIIINKQCDDGNVASGDGCSRDCKVEYGFECTEPNKPCRETIPPTFGVTTVTVKNQIYIEFSESIMIKNETDLSKENLIIEIKGSRASYVFDYRIIQDVKNPLIPNRYINKLSIILQNIKTSLDGTEDLKVYFMNYGNITDIAGNPLVKDSYFTTKPATFAYISESEANTAEGGGQSLKYTFISVFSVNIALKFVLNSSMQYLWGLVHSLQVFNFLLFMNIEFPDNVLLFSKYLQVASGDIDEFNQYIPNVADMLVNQKNINEKSDNDKLQQKFKDNDISPYFLVAFGQKLTLWCVGFLILLPAILLMNKLCKKIRLWEQLVSQFFFNGPLRTFVEMYIELILQVIINTQFLKFKNYDQSVATLIAFIFGAVSLLLPFLTMTIIYHNRRHVKNLEWKKKFGMLTDECRSHSILQLYYYPLFIYQRLCICGIIVYLYDAPFFQCVAVMICNFAMILYLIIVRPFKEESQQTTTVLDEFVIMVCVGVFLLIYRSKLGPDELKEYGWGIVILILFSVIKNFSVVIYFGVLQARKKIKQMFQEEDLQKDSPHTSDDEYDQVNEQDENFNTLELIEEIKIENQTRFANLDNTRYQSNINHTINYSTYKQ